MPVQGCISFSICFQLFGTDLEYLESVGFDRVRGYGFGLYPFPNFMQPLLEKIDPYHCHQMVFIAHKTKSS